MISVTQIPNSPWVSRIIERDAKVRLFCFSYAGGSANAFAPWAAQLGPQIELCAIQLPGRGIRFSEPLVSDWQQLLAPLAEAISSYDDLPFAFFGHSLGGMIAYELSQYCAKLGLALPCQLIVSATNAPQHRKADSSLHRLNDADLLQRLRSYAGTPKEVLDNSELMELLLPIFRADLSLLRNYSYRHQQPLEIPISVFAGEEDQHLDKDTLACWQEETQGAFSEHWFAGGHFYINPCQEQVIVKLRAALLSES
jgi:medium-chain acyl-[acyl-carrier-protein] hydrolase